MASFNDLDHEEALKLFEQARVCEDYDDWAPDKNQRDCWTLTCGVINKGSASRAGLLVELTFRRSFKTKSIWYKFTVFKQQPWGLERAYQLDILQHAKKITTHDMPHEHMGSKRVEGNKKWLDWDFAEVLARFTEQTNIEFNPQVDHPEKFELKG